MNDWLSKLARQTNDLLGSPPASVACFLLLLLWTLWGWHEHFSMFSQMVLSTLTSLAATQMSFLILATQNKDSKAVHLKLDEILRAQEAADNRFRRIESAPDATIRELTDDGCPPKVGSAKVGS